VVIDLWSRAVIGWSMAPRMTAQLTCDALQMALWRRKHPENVIVHTDRGGQYCSADYQALLKRHNLRGSMSARGCCYDNACVESFFHSLKVECIHGERFISREMMRTTVFNYIECDYNRWRRHSACGGLSPEQFENRISLSTVSHYAGRIKFILRHKNHSAWTTLPPSGSSVQISIT
jgi:putative transposase